MDSSYQRLDPDNISYDSDNEDIDVSHARNGRRLSRDLEEGFRDSDSEEEERDGRLGGNIRRNNSNLRELPPTPVDDEPRDRFPATRI